MTENADHPFRRLTEPDQPDLIYDRQVRTRVFLRDPDHLVAEASLADDTYAPGGFQTIHDMALRMEIELPEMVITAAEPAMTSHPHRWCPETLAHLDRLVGLQIAAGYFSALNQRLGGTRSCNHLLALAQNIGTVVALSYAARMSVLEPELNQAPADDYFRVTLGRNPHVVDSCYVWRDGGPLTTHLRALETDGRAGGEGDPLD